MSTDDLSAVVAEMRERKVCGGKYESPTLMKWADRIEARAVIHAELVQQVEDLLSSHPEQLSYPDGPCIERDQRRDLVAALARAKGETA